jgi:hypothetical protein
LRHVKDWKDAHVALHDLAVSRTAKIYEMRKPPMTAARSSCFCLAPLRLSRRQGGRSIASPGTMVHISNRRWATAESESTYPSAPLQLGYRNHSEEAAVFAPLRLIYVTVSHPMASPGRLVSATDKSDGASKCA